MQGLLRASPAGTGGRCVVTTWAFEGTCAHGGDASPWDRRPCFTTLCDLIPTETLRLRCIICSLQIWTLREKLTSMSNSTRGFEGRLTSLQICTVSTAPLWLQGFLRGTQLLTGQRPSRAWSSALHSGTSLLHSLDVIVQDFSLG